MPSARHGPLVALSRTGASISGSAEPGTIVRSAAIAMLSMTPVALAASIASRSEQWVALQVPSSASSAAVTVKVAACALPAAAGRIARPIAAAASVRALMAPRCQRPLADRFHGFEPDWTDALSSGTLARSMAAHAHHIASQPMPGSARGQERVRTAATGVTFNLDPAGG